MGDRFFPSRHGNITLLLQRSPSPPAWSLPGPSLPGIGHNGGPPLDLSGSGWLWRRAVAKAWAAPPREVAMQRLRRAERLGLAYREFAAALMDTGSNLSIALLPLHHLAIVEQRRDGSLALHEDDAVGADLRRFEGRLFLVIDEAATGSLEAKARRRLAGLLATRFVQCEGLLVLPFRPAESAGQRAARLNRLLRAKGLHRKECFWLGRTPSELQLAQQAGLGFFKPLAGWFAGG